MTADPADLLISGGRDGEEHPCLNGRCQRTHKRARTGWAKDFCSLNCYREHNGLPPARTRQPRPLAAVPAEPTPVPALTAPAEEPEAVAVPEPPSPEPSRRSFADGVATALEVVYALQRSGTFSALPEDRQKAIVREALT
jgi:hypothetical protein